VGHLRGEVQVPGDNRSSHRHSPETAIADGEAHVREFGLGEDVRSSMAAMRRLALTSRDRPNACAFEGRMAGLRARDVPLRLGTRHTTRLLSGILAAQPFLTVLTGEIAALRPWIDHHPLADGC